MLACKVPASLKKGTILFSYEAISYVDGSSSIEDHQWHVRSVQKRKTYRSLCGTKIRGSREATFVSLARKIAGESRFDEKWARYIPKHLSVKFEWIERLPNGIYTTRLQAVKFAIKKQMESIASIEVELASVLNQNDTELWEEELAYTKKELTLLKRTMTKIKKLSLK